MKIDKYFHLWADKSTVHFDEVAPFENKQKGKWIKWGSEVKCSECHICNPINKPFCPNCGSEMENE